MKKILAIVTMAAMVAGAFAADVSAKAKLYGSLFDYAGSASAFDLNGHHGEDWEPDLAVSYSDDASGAAFALKSNNAVSTTNWNIWFKPIDILKINIGGADVCLNKETIDWSGITGLSASGWGAEVSTNGVFFGAYLGTGFGKFLNNNAVVAPIAVKFAYSADFGTIGAFANIKSGSTNAGLGYSGAAGAISYFADAVFAVDAKALDVDVFFCYSDAVTVKLYLKPSMSFGNGFNFGGLCYKFRVDAKAGDLGVYFYSSSGNVLGSPLSLTFKPGVTGSVGACGWELAANMTLTGSAFSIGLPVNFTVNW